MSLVVSVNQKEISVSGNFPKLPSAINAIKHYIERKVYEVKSYTVSKNKIKYKIVSLEPIDANNLTIELSGYIRESILEHMIDAASMESAKSNYALTETEQDKLNELLGT